MINLEYARELRIKRANTDWWIHEKAMVGTNGLTYIAYMTDMGEIHVKELDAKCSRAPSHDVCLCRLNANYADEHNAPSICVLDNGIIVVAYTGHNANGSMAYRVTTRPFDIFSFGPEQRISYNGSATYAQLSFNSARGELWLFARVNGVNWQFCCSKDEGRTWSAPVNFLHSDDGGLFYFDVRKIHCATPKGPQEQWFFALYGHPRISKDHTIRSGIFDSDGWLLTMDNERTDISLFGEKHQLSLNDLATVYESPEGTTVRLLAVSPTKPYRVGFAPFTLNQPATIRYVSATWRDGAWRISAPIASGGEFLAPLHMLDGSQTYLGGMAYYYGVGEAGFHPNDPACIDTNRIYIARFDGQRRVLESYVSHDCGNSYQVEQVIRTIDPAKQPDVKIWRPTVPIYAQDNLPLYWHEGTYTAHTGGWHCDEVMLVEYDD